MFLCIACPARSPPASARGPPAGSIAGSVASAAAGSVVQHAVPGNSDYECGCFRGWWWGGGDHDDDSRGGGGDGSGDDGGGVRVVYIMTLSTPTG